MQTYRCDPDRPPLEGPQAALEQLLISEFLHERGHRLADLERMAEEEVRALMQQACRYAALKLAEIESRSKLRKTIEAPVG